MKKLIEVIAEIEDFRKARGSAPTNGKRCCSKEPCLSNDKRVEWSASSSSNTWGGKPTDKESDLGVSTGKGNQPCVLG